MPGRRIAVHPDGTVTDVTEAGDDENIINQQIDRERNSARGGMSGLIQNTAQAFAQPAASAQGQVPSAFLPSAAGLGLQSTVALLGQQQQSAQQQAQQRAQRQAGLAQSIEADKDRAQEIKVLQSRHKNTVQLEQLKDKLQDQAEKRQQRRDKKTGLATNADPTPEELELLNQIDMLQSQEKIADLTQGARTRPGDAPVAASRIAGLEQPVADVAATRAGTAAQVSETSRQPTPLEARQQRQEDLRATKLANDLLGAEAIRADEFAEAKLRASNALALSQERTGLSRREQLDEVDRLNTLTAKLRGQKGVDPETGLPTATIGLTTALRQVHAAKEDPLFWFEVNKADPFWDVSNDENVESAVAAFEAEASAPAGSAGGFTFADGTKIQTYQSAQGPVRVHFVGTHPQTGERLYKYKGQPVGPLPK